MEISKVKLPHQTTNSDTHDKIEKSKEDNFHNTENYHKPKQSSNSHKNTLIGITISTAAVAWMLFR